MTLLLALRSALPTILRLAPYLLIAAVVWWIMGMRSDLADVRRENVVLAASVKAESAARARDVAALTTLSGGLVQAASAKSIDEKVLSNAINANDPKPASSSLRALLDGLRKADADRGVPATAPRAGSPARPGSGRS